MFYEPVFARWFGRDNRVRFGRPLWARKFLKKTRLEKSRDSNPIRGVVFDDGRLVEQHVPELAGRQKTAQKIKKVICTPCLNYRIFNYEAWLFWFVMLAITTLVEYAIVAPIGIGVTYSSLCAGTVCVKDFAITAMTTPEANACASCVLSLVAVYTLVILTSFIDLFVVFNFVLAIWGFIKGIKKGSSLELFIYYLLFLKPFTQNMHIHPHTSYVHCRIHA